MKNNKLFLPFLLLTLAFLYALPIFNKLWHSYDEGWNLVNADLIAHGEIPYKDFWLISSPGQFYILATLFKIFGKSLAIGRIYTIFLHSLICFMVFLITKQLCALKYAFLSWFIAAVSLVPRMGPTPTPEWIAMLFVLLSLIALSTYIKRQKPDYFWLSLTGLLSGAVFIFRQDFGIYTLISGSLTILILSISRNCSKNFSLREKAKKIFLELVLFLAPVVIVLSSALYYFARNSALGDLFYQLFYFPLRIYPETRSMLFPKFCFNPNMLFHKSCYFISINQFYIPLIILFLAVSLLLIKMYKRRGLSGDDFIVLALSLNGLFFLNCIRVRTDIMHLVPILPVFLILFGFLVSRLHNTTYFFQHKYLRRAIAVFAIVFMGSFVIKNMDKYMKNGYTKALQGKIVPVKFELGTVYIPKQKAPFIKEVVSFVRNNTADNEKIFVGNASHIETSGTELMFYFLSDRLPATGYYTFQPGLTDQPKVQKEMVESIKKDVNLIVLAEIPEPEGIDAEEVHSPLDTYIRGNCISIKDIGPYHVYRKKVDR